ncbi:MAG: DUF2851 family protein [Verrucomicrobia bacterium]|nr:DUF2851 family protein [Verrucomicrobiota bacterium]
MTTGLYAQWRERLRRDTLREGAGGAPAEKLLQAIWQHQRLHRDRLRTLDGRRVRVLHPGFWNHGAGPDFRSAVVQLDADPARSGDIEVDRERAGWHGHGHDTNRNFAGVILHVVWDAPEKNAPPDLPTLALRPLLDAPLDELELWLGGDAPELPAEFRGKCSAPLAELDAGKISALLADAARVRLAMKAAQLAARAKDAGWEQALWEGLFAALGYRHNVWPLRRLAELIPQIRAAASADGSLQHWQARLLGLGGLLPAEVSRRHRGADDYLLRLWEIWWRERDAWEEFILPRATWRLAGLRPANQPPRRLALASHWLAAGDLPTRLEAWLRAEAAPEKSAVGLLKLLQPERDEFWSWHLTLAGQRAAKPQALLGAPRATDLAVNVVLPWLWARADAGRNAAARAQVEARYFAWPAAEDNTVLKRARQRLLGGSPPRLFRTAAAQQGLLQIVRDFCDHSNAVCDQCRFPDLVRQFSTATA